MASNQHHEEIETTQWNNPTDHVRPRSKLLSMWIDKTRVVEYTMKTKSYFLGHWSIHWMSPAYFFFTHFSARNRNLFLTENHLSYRPYKFRRNDNEKY